MLILPLGFLQMDLDLFLKVITSHLNINILENIIF